MPFFGLICPAAEQATDPSQPCEDWNLNMEICDMINDTDEGCALFYFIFTAENEKVFSKLRSTAGLLPLFRHLKAD